MILRALWWRPTARAPWRALATVAGVAVGVAALCATWLTTRVAVASIDRDVETIAGAARLEVTRPGGVPLADLGPLADLCGEVLCAPVIDGTALAPALGERVRVLGIDPLVDRGARSLRFDRGEGPSEEAGDAFLRGEGVALPAALARALGAAVGDRIELAVRSERVALDVVALFEPARLAAAWDRVVLLDVARASELLGRVARLDRLELVPRRPLDSAALDELAQRIAARLPEGTRVAGPEARRAEGRDLVRALDFNLTALAGVSLIVGAVLVATTLATSVVQRRSAIALLRSLGASRAQLGAAVLAEAAAIGLIGGLLGVVLGAAAARGVLAAVQASVATVAEEAIAGELALGAPSLLLGLALGLGSALVAAWMPLREALGTPPLQGLREVPEERALGRMLARHGAALAALLIAAALAARLPPLRERPVGGLVCALLLLAALLACAEPLVAALAGLRPRGRPALRAAPLRVAQGALAAGRRRAAWAAGAVGVAVALAVSMGVFVTSFRRAVGEWSAQTLRADLHVQPLPPEGGVSAGVLHPDVTRAAVSRFGAENVDAYHSGPAYVRGERVELAGGNLALLAREGGVPFLDGRPAREVFARALERGALIVNEPFARRFGVGRGDRVRLETPAGGLERAVEGVYRDYSGHRGRAVLDLAAFLALYPDEGAKSLSIFLPAGASPEEARARLAADLGPRFAVAIRLEDELRRQVLAVFDRTFAVTIALRTIASLVAAIAVVTVLAALVHERARELAVLRSIGGSRAQVAGVVLSEAGLLGLAGAGGGLVTGLMVGYVLVAVVNVQSFGWSMPFAPSWSGILATAGLVLPACGIAGLVPALSALRASPREAWADG